MSEALQKVKRDLGRDAVILHTRTFKKGGLLGFGARAVVEIAAARQINVLPPDRRRSMIPSQRAGPSAGAEGAAVTGVVNAAGPEALPEGWRDEMARMRRAVEQLVRESRRERLADIPEQLLATYQSLLQGQVADELATDLIARVRSKLTGEQLADRQAVFNVLAGAIAGLVPTTGAVLLDGRHGARVIALVGPTGVGKTTTIAKLAANFRLRDNKKVGLITIDTYRIAAVDQLKTYAEIIDVALEVVLTPDELVEAVERLRGSDVILIDTAGRSQNDAARLSELRQFLDRIKPHEVHLVLSSTSTRRNLLEAIERFSKLGADRVIFTKLDEAVGFGVILNVIGRVERGLSYLTTGQEVPDDIEVARGDRLARLILGGPLGSLADSPALAIHAAEPAD